MHVFNIYLYFLLRSAGYGSFGDPNYGQPNLKPTPPPVQSPQGVMGPPGISTVQQQLMNVRSPPPIRSPQPNPSPRPVPSPRSGPVPSPHHHPSGHQGTTPTHSPAHELGGPSEMMLSQLSQPGGQVPGGPGSGQMPSGQMAHHPSPAAPSVAGAQDNDVTPMTPQDQLSKFVEGL